MKLIFPEFPGNTELELVHDDRDSDRHSIYQCGVIANDASWDVDQCVKYVRPPFFEQELPYVKEGADVTFVQSKTLFLFIELILYEIPLFLLCAVAWFVNMFSVYFWVKLYYQMMGIEYGLPLDAASKKREQGLDEQVRALQMALYDKPYTFVKRARFMKKARGKLNWFNANYTYFVNQRWHFDHSNVKALYASLDSESRTKYDFNVDDIHFNQYATDAALVCFHKYIEYRDQKKQAQRKMEEGMKEKLDFLIKQQTEQSLCGGKQSLSKDEKLPILHVLRKMFFLDAKVSCCIFLGMSILATFSFFVW